MQARETVFLIGGVAAMGFAAALAWIRAWHRRIPVAPRDMNVDGAGPAENVPPAVVLDLSMLLHLDLSLAAEHVHSIQGQLEIARQYGQPIPRSALTNLELLSSHMGEIKRRIEAAGGGPAAK